MHKSTLNVTLCGFLCPGDSCNHLDCWNLFTINAWVTLLNLVAVHLFDVSFPIRWSDFSVQSSIYSFDVRGAMNGWARSKFLVPPKFRSVPSNGNHIVSREWAVFGAMIPGYFKIDIVESVNNLNPYPCIALSKSLLGPNWGIEPWPGPPIGPHSTPLALILPIPYLGVIRFFC